MVGTNQLLEGFKFHECWLFFFKGTLFNLLFGVFIFNLIRQRHVAGSSLILSDGSLFHSLPIVCVCPQSLNMRRYLSPIGA